MKNKKNVLIIGAGCAGLSSAIYLSRSKYSFCIVEKEMLGGKLNVITDIENYPGYEKISGIELIENYQKQLKNLGIEITKDSIIDIKKNGDGFIAFSNENEYYIDNIIIATGSTNIKANIPGETEFIGKGISYCAVCDGFFNRGKDVLVFGRDLKSIKEAIYLENLVKKLYFVTDINLENIEEFIKLKSSSKVEVLYPYTIEKFTGNDGLESATIKNILTNEVREISCFGAFPFVGETPSNSFIKSLSIKTEKGYIKVDDNQETNVKGIYAAGDIVSKQLKQIVTAGSDGAIAATSIIKNLNNK